MLPARLRKLLRSEQADVFTAEMLKREAETLPALDRLAPKRPYVLFLEPPSLDERIVNQYALFSLMSSPTAQMDDWIRAHRKLSHKIVIPAKLKWEVRDKLDQANITERVLFPGLDGLSRVLKRYYSPRNVAARDKGSKGSRPVPGPEAEPVNVRPEDGPALLNPESTRARRARAAASSAHGGNGTFPPASAGRKQRRRPTRSARAARGK
jgi:hypothetical protein